MPETGASAPGNDVELARRAAKDRRAFAICLVTLGNFEGAMSRYTLADEHFTDSRWKVGR